MSQEDKRNIQIIKKIVLSILENPKDTDALEELYLMAVGMMGRYAALDGSGIEDVGIYLQEFAGCAKGCSEGISGECEWMEDNRRELYRSFEVKYGISLDEVLKNPEF